MGLLVVGTPEHWDEAWKHADHVRQHGIQQLLNIFHAVKARVNDSLLWGDEVGARKHAIQLPNSIRVD